MSKYKFSKDILGLSAGNFKEFVKGRYPEITDKDLKGLIEEHYGKDSGVEIGEPKKQKDGNSTPAKGKTEATTK